jgi:UDP-N-acetylglucosamine--N-acetylmuramyl-(pentapeptide) pyrophosphoryl-undecaprenol N-acetylglucosamine transferase
VVVVGGYASVACTVAAVLLRVPIVVAEQNAAPGLANRLAGRFAKACAVSFPGTPLPRPVVTGNPVRPEILAVDRSPEGQAAARIALGLPQDRKVVAVAGGSLGARRINQAVLGLVEAWAGCERVAIRHVAGPRNFESVASEAPGSASGGGRLVYQVVPFEDRMDLLLAAADVGVHRSGASTVSELTVVGLPAVLVPLPGAPADHQTENALRLANAGAAVLVPDGELDANRLQSELRRLLDDDARLDAMGAAARQMARPEAAAAVAALVEEHARG